MFQKTLTAVTTARPADVYALYADVRAWPSWDEDVERVTLEGPFATGTRGTLAMKGRPPLSLTLTEVTPDVGFADETQVGPMTVRFRHVLTPMFGGTRIAHTVEVEGPGADALGADIASGVAHTVEGLARRAAQSARPQLGGVLLYTADPARAADVYVRGLGLEIALAGPAGDYVQLGGAVPLAFAARTMAEKLPVPPRALRADEAPAAAELMFIVVDVAAAVARAIEAGLTAFVEPRVMPWGQTVAYVRDPDGVLVELCTPWG
jgi:catechol 2,3-dioxygenase-like lactoylglutathione lyase family enzyme